MPEAVLEIIESVEFSRWLPRLKDRTGRQHIARSIGRLARTGIGDLKSVGDGVRELRVHVGPGYRIYLTQRGQRLILLLCGGDKDSQTRDIERAHALARQTP